MRSGSVTEAGKLLRLTQPTISKLIAQLERSMGMKIFNRMGGRLVPLPEAETLLHQVDKIFGAVEELGRNAKRLANGHSGHLRIVAVPPLALRFLPTAIAGFRETHPDVRITLNMRGSSYIPDWIATQQADLGFISSRATFAGTISPSFMSNPAVCVLPKTHPLTAKRTLTPKDLAEQDFVALGRDTPFSHLLERVFSDAGVDRRIMIEVGHSAMAGAMVARGHGVTVLDPVSALDQFAQGGVALRRLTPEVMCETRLIHPARGGLPLLAQAFIKHLETHIKHFESELKAALSSRSHSKRE
jgi:DNA-binding transcriptional LysR family regulator